MLAGIRSRRDLYGRVLRIEVIPLRRLGRPGIGEGALLRRDRDDDAGDSPGSGLISVVPSHH